MIEDKLVLDLNIFDNMEILFKKYKYIYCLKRIDYDSLSNNKWKHIGQHICSINNNISVNLFSIDKNIL